MKGIINALKRQLERQGLDGLLVSSDANISYLSGFTGNESYLLLGRGRDFFITDSRYAQQAKRETESFKIELANGTNTFGLIADLINTLKSKRIGFEAKGISFGEFCQIKNRVGARRLVPTYDFIEGYRAIKKPQEIQIIEDSINIVISAFKQTEGAIKAGVREAKIAADIEYHMRTLGASSPSFETIVASGNKSSMPHITASSHKRIGPNQHVLIDAGARFKGYHSDLTRVFFTGRITATLKEIYDIVKQAQRLAIKKIKPGVKASYIDTIARNYIAKKGFGKFFGHSLGHGVGREVHEAPVISSKSQNILKSGMVFTVEPAIYIPGAGGIRIEDMVLVTDKGCEVLSKNLDK